MHTTFTAQHALRRSALEDAAAVRRLAKARRAARLARGEGRPRQSSALHEAVRPGPPVPVA